MTKVVLPTWVRLAAAVAVLAVIYLLGRLDGERTGGEQHIAYVEAQAAQAATLVRAQSQVLRETETKYRDRIHRIYIKGDEIEKEVPVYVTPGDSDAYGVNAGFVRAYNAAWTGTRAGPPAGSDRGPAAVSLTEVAEVDAHNAAACLAWREQAIGLREAYRNVQDIINGASAASDPR